MGKYNSHPEYNHLPTGLLSSAPSNWDIKRLKYISSINDDVLPESTPPDSEFNYVDIGSVSVDKGIVRTEPMKFEDAPSRARRKVKTGDVIVSTVRTYLKAIAPIDRNADSLVVSTGFCVIRPRRDVVPRYCGYLMQAPFLVEQIVSESVGVSYPAINASQIANMAVPLPTEKEQTQISIFLDRETAKIDRLIEKQQRLIELLEEKRQAVISHAVTKGLNPDAPIRDSGVEWLGEIPAHWRTDKLSRACFMQEGPGLRNWQFTEDGIRVICVTNITDSGIDFSKLAKYISQEEYETSYKRFTVSVGDILLSSSGNSWGKVATYEGTEHVILNTSTIRLNELNATVMVRDFLSLYLQSSSCREQLSLAMTGACQPNFGPSHLKEVIACLPSIEEQRAISTHVSETTNKIIKLIQKAKKSINLMKERRTALISAAVTGKIDVRDQVQQDDEKAFAS